MVSTDSRLTLTRTRLFFSVSSTRMNLRRLASGSSLKTELCFCRGDGDDFSSLVATVDMEAEVEMAWLGME